MCHGIKTLCGQRFCKPWNVALSAPWGPGCHKTLHYQWPVAREPWNNFSCFPFPPSLGNPGIFLSKGCDVRVYCAEASSPGCVCAFCILEGHCCYVCLNIVFKAMFTKYEQLFLFHSLCWKPRDILFTHYGKILWCGPVSIYTCWILPQCEMIYY